MRQREEEEEEAGGKKEEWVKTADMRQQGKTGAKWRWKERGE